MAISFRKEARAFCLVRRNSATDRGIPRGVRAVRSAHLDRSFGANAHFCCPGAAAIGCIRSLGALGAHSEFRHIARRYVAGERRGHTLQTSALVNEAYVRLIDVKQVRWQKKTRIKEASTNRGFESPSPPIERC